MAEGHSSAQGQGPSRRGVLRAGLGAAALAGTAGWRAAPPARPRQAALAGPDARPYPHLPEGADTIPQIQHIVVLMMENHSYDNHLGMLKRAGADGFALGSDGLPLATNPDPDGRTVRLTGAVRGGLAVDPP